MFAVTSAHSLECLADTLLTPFAPLQPEGTEPAAAITRVGFQVGGFPRFFERGPLRLAELPLGNRRVLVKQVRIAFPVLPCDRGDNWPARLQPQLREPIAGPVVTRRLVEPAVIRHAHAASIPRRCDSDRHTAARCIGFRINTWRPNGQRHTSVA